MYTEESVETFLKNQGQLFDEAVASSYEEAEEFLEDCMAVEVETMKEVRAYFDETDVCSSVRRISSGRRLIKSSEPGKTAGKGYVK